MQKQFISVILSVLFFTAACAGPVNPPVEQIEPTAPAAEASQPGDFLEETISQADLVGPDCLGEDISPIGQSIAEDYESANYEQVMTWFCNGAEFEDILVALETEAQTDSSADDLLNLLAEGFTWEEIWQSVGLTE